MNRIAELLALTRKDVAARKEAKPVVPDDDRRIRWSRRRFHLIAEVKRSSLSEGAIRPDLDVQSLVRAYESAGASAVSILTEPHFFHGSLDDLSLARACTRLPILQKDFVLDEYQIFEAKIRGADFVLLIARFLSANELSHLMRVSDDIKMNALVEVCDQHDLQKLSSVPAFLGVNARNLETLKVETEKFEELRRNLSETFRIAESGIRNDTTLRQVLAAGYNGALVGEHFLRSPDPGREAARFLDVARSIAKRYERTEKPSIKICGITSERDAFGAIEAGADALGFIFAESPRRIDAEVLFRLRHKIPSHVLAVGVFKDQSAEEIQKTCYRFGLDVAQVYDESHNQTDQWTARRIDRLADLEKYVHQDRVLWDVKVSASERKRVWVQFSNQKVFALAGNLTAENVQEAVQICRPEWVDVASGVETEPGRKDQQRMIDFIRAARST